MAGVTKNAIRNSWLLVIGVVGLVLGLTPSTPLPIFMAVHAAAFGGALVIIAAIRYLLALLMGWDWATAAVGALAVVQYPLIKSIPAHAMFHYWSAVMAICGAALLVAFSAVWLAAKLRPKTQYE